MKIRLTRWIASFLAAALLGLAPGPRAYAAAGVIVSGQAASSGVPRVSLPGNAGSSVVVRTATPVALASGLSHLGAAAPAAHPAFTAGSVSTFVLASGAPALAPVRRAAVDAPKPVADLRTGEKAAPAPAATDAPAAADALDSAAAKAGEIAAAPADAATDRTKAGAEFDASGAKTGAEPVAAGSGTKSFLRNPFRFGRPSAQRSGVPAKAAAVAAAPETAPAAAERSSRNPFVRGWNWTKAVAGTFRNMAGGDPELEHLLKPVKKDMRTARILLVFDAVFAIAMAFLTGPLLDTALAASKFGLAAYAPHLALLTGLMLAAFVGYTLVERGHAYLGRAVGLKSTADYRVALQKSFVAQEMDFHMSATSGSLAGRLLNDTNFLSSKNVSIRLTLLHYMLYLVFGVALLIRTSPTLSLAVALVVPLLGWLNSKYGDKIAKLGIRQTDQKAELLRFAQESLQQAETVKTFASAKQELDRYGARVDEAADISMQDARLTSNYVLISGALTDFFTKYLIYILGGWALALGLGLTFGQVTQLTAFAYFAKYAFSGLSSLFMQYKRYEGSSKTVRELLLRKPAIVDPTDAAALPDGPGEIRFDGVTFAYPARQSEPILNDLSFVAKPGETVAFVGETGSGKSTITRLLLRLWEPQGGRITVDGREIREVTRASLLGRVAVVPQGTRLFNGTLRQNMLYGREGATEAELESAIRRAGASFVFDRQRFPEALETQVAEGGGRLSGGERQRVAIVRALLRSPSILILDEATSALDNKSERDVQDSLDKLAGGADGRRPTTLVVAHRLSTIRDADRINFLEKGRIVESGTHAELLALNGRYARLWKEGGYDDAAASAAKRDAETAEAASAPATAAAAAPAAAVEPAKKDIRAAWNRLVSTLTNFVAGDRDFRPFLSSRKAALIGAAVLMVLEIGASLAASNFLGRFLDAAAATGGAVDGRLLWMLSAGIGASVVVVMAAQRQSAWLLGKLRALTLADLRRALMARLHAMPMSFHLKNESATLASRLNEDAESLVKKNVDVRVPILRDTISLVVSSALLLHSNLIVGLLVFLMIPGLGILSGLYGQKTEALYKTFSQRRAELGRGGQETLEQIQTIKTFAREDAAVADYKSKADALVETGLVGAKIGATSHMLSSALTDFFTRHLIYIAGSWAVGMALGLTIGQIAVMTFYAAFVKGAFDGLSSKWMDYKQAHGESATVLSWLAQSPAVDAPGAKPLPPGRGEINFEGVSFRYGEGVEGGLIEDLNLRIEAGTTVALVGSSGSGKSTVLKLLQGLWTPQKGRVMIDGLAQADATRESLARAIAKVPQETRLFDASIRYNMTYGTPGATDAELEAAIRSARAEFVYDKEKFPEGLDTAVGEGGGKLSGGQLQRVAIVRALLRKPRILLLDEATSALDKKTEREIQETLDHLTNGESGLKPTTVVVAHNLTTIMGADKIVVLERGRVVEQGKHAELLAKDGAYARLWRASRHDAH